MEEERKKRSRGAPAAPGRNSGRNSGGGSGGRSARPGRGDFPAHLPDGLVRLALYLGYGAFWALDSRLLLGHGIWSALVAVGALAGAAALWFVPSWWRRARRREGGRSPSAGGPHGPRGGRTGPGSRRPPLPPRPRAGRRPQPGQVWYAYVPFEEGGGGKDRPCLVVGAGPTGATVLKITSQDKSDLPEHYWPIANTGWNRSGHESSWLQNHTPLRVPYDGFRRPLGLCPADLWREVTDRLDLSAAR
ncbi:type II toxin-antitoxin system PemK/MazF family toxin [Kitasatospora fiedleri]|uniref:type II toxin-antitoxin system PemK/MazF family toxin n=1 Tax=Kitasatospora fiedleri TaxID=2991545 RepID=UPI00249B38B2|nr:type II toxin-antitoxin system PemK/MazF family toxin [Kitasatospora fiedleri]